MEHIHYILIGLVIVIIVTIQVWIYYKTQRRINNYKNIFPNSIDAYSYNNEQITGIQDIDQDDSVLIEIISSINKYLVKNKGAISDFHLMKDIVDRNCDSKEDEINTQIPVPLYLGLMGTMVGILIGIGFLVFTGGLDALLSSSDWAGKGISGVRTLMGGIALAMVSSILGILLTTMGSYSAKNAKKYFDKTKNTFLSWIQSELLPNLPGDVSGAFAQLTQNLTKFNILFSDNTNDLRATLENVNESYRNQAELLKAVNELKIKDIASVNIEIYDKLKNCTDEIGLLGSYLENVKTYLETLHQSIIKTGNYFGKEVEQIEERKGVISKAVGKIDNELQTIISAIKNNAENQVEDLKKSTVRQTEALKQAIELQQEALNKKLQETPGIVTELRNLPALRSIMDNLAQAINAQNHKIDNLVRSIHGLAKMETEDNGFFIPKWAKISFIVGFGIISFSCLIYLVNELLKVFGY